MQPPKFHEFESLPRLLHHDQIASNQFKKGERKAFFLKITFFHTYIEMEVLEEALDMPFSTASNEVWKIAKGDGTNKPTIPHVRAAEDV